MIRTVSSARFNIGFFVGGKELFWVVWVFCLSVSVNKLIKQAFIILVNVICTMSNKIHKPYLQYVYFQNIDQVFCC